MVGTRITGRGSRRLSRCIRVTDSTIRIGSVQRLAFGVRRSAFGVRRLAARRRSVRGGTRSRAIRRNTSMKLRIQELDRLQLSCLIMSYLDVRRRIARDVPSPNAPTPNAERRTPNAERLHLLCLGSRASRRPSPRKFRARSVNDMAIAGNTNSHQ